MRAERSIKKFERWVRKSIKTKLVCSVDGKVYLLNNTMVFEFEKNSSFYISAKKELLTNFKSSFTIIDRNYIESLFKFKVEDIFVQSKATEATVSDVLLDYHNKTLRVVTFEHNGNKELLAVDESMLEFINFRQCKVEVSGKRKAVKFIGNGYVCYILPVVFIGDDVLDKINQIV